ncbi:hypothetical protein [Pseudomonas putida]|uniref:hypothetical protein n=1 Tax=Pseudomonas putida TaxID=303 RepID=UPI001E5FB338|nr:hypothetical protein [Pseudomonas putida]MCE0975304.1 hypothetical protein [Pseudomonas putida]
MRGFSRLISLAFVSSIVAGCGSEDFTGAYRYKIAGGERVIVLNVHGDEAEIFGEDARDGRIKPLVKMKVSVKDKKLLLDDVNSSERLALTRNVDEQSVDCLNCKVLGINDAAVWKYDPQGPYDVERMLKDQALKDEKALNAELLKMQEQIYEQAKRDEEATKLGAYEGDWVYQRTTKQDPLIIMTIWRKNQIKRWSFRFESMDRIGQEAPGFEVSDVGLKVKVGSENRLYSLSPDKQILTCATCNRPERWVKADPKKDLSDRNYARQMAGNP